MPDDPAPARCQPEGLRARKKLATRRAISIAAMGLAVRRGLDNVLVEEIAAEAGVSARTFSNYYGSKYEAICALAMDRGRQTGEALLARPASEPLGDAITNAVLEQYAAAEQPPDKVWIDGLRLVVRSPALQGEYLKTHYVTQRALACAIAERTGTDPAADMFPLVIAGAVSAATQVAMEHWLLCDPPAALAPIIRRALGDLSLNELAVRRSPDRRSPDQGAAGRAAPASPDPASGESAGIAARPPLTDCPLPA